MADKVEKTREEWRRELDSEQFEVCRNKGTERAFTWRYWDCKDEGIYSCSACGNELFGSDAKYDSGTGWPSFTAPLSEDCVRSESDHSMGVVRTEVLCARCDSHLGHVFPDGPSPTGQRYCMNSASLDLHRKRAAERVSDGRSQSPAGAATLLRKRAAERVSDGRSQHPQGAATPERKKAE